MRQKGNPNNKSKARVVIAYDAEQMGGKGTRRYSARGRGVPALCDPVTRQWKGKSKLGTSVPGQ